MITNSWLVPAALFAILCTAAFIADRRIRDRKRPKVHEFKMGHRPVPDALELVFGGFAGGSKVHSLIVKQDGIHVTFDDGSAYLFLAVPEGQAAYIDKGGKLKVTEPR